MKIYFAPLEGVTGHIFRNTYEKLYGQVDKYFAPFISPSEKYVMIPKELKDLSPENNSNYYLVPQILTSRADLFINAANELKALGYKEINLNLGCPSGTVCSKGKGAGFLKDPNGLKSFFEDVYTYADNNQLEISVKTRIGYEDPDEFYNLVNIFNEFPISELIVHPRIRTDYYKGDVRQEYYKYALENVKCPLVYNGNIFSKENYDNLCNYLNQDIDTVMLGRGLIGNPELINELNSGSHEIDYNRFWKLHDTLYHEYQKIMSPDINVLYKMKELWTFWKIIFEDNEREIKKLLKTKKYAEYEAILRTLK